MTVLAEFSSASPSPVAGVFFIVNHRHGRDGTSAEDLPPISHRAIMASGCNPYVCSLGILLVTCQLFNAAQAASTQIMVAIESVHFS